jgi:hypothetical protein
MVCPSRTPPRPRGGVHLIAGGRGRASNRAAARARGFAAHWMQVVPHPVGRHRVVAPDVPRLGQSVVRVGRLDARGLAERLDRADLRRAAYFGRLLAGRLPGGPLRRRSRGSSPPNRPGQLGRPRPRWTSTRRARRARQVQHAPELTMTGSSSMSSIQNAFETSRGDAGPRSGHTTWTERPRRRCARPTVNCCGV